MEGQDDGFDERVEPIAVILTAFVPRYLWECCPQSIWMSRHFDESLGKIGWRCVENLSIWPLDEIVRGTETSGHAARARQRRFDRRECGQRDVRIGRYRAHA